jgi:serine/threonine protein kinase
LAASLAEESLRRLGRYRVERLVGAGRSGAVFLGRDPILGRPVALKVIPLRAGVRSTEREKRLELLGATFRHLGGLSHPHLVTVHDAGIEEEYAYLVMDFVPGRDLEAALGEGGALPAKSVLELGRELAAGLDYAHASGFVHGDLRPSSVLLPPSGTAKVVDFGIASALSASRLSHAVSLWDTPTYLAPESLTGTPGPASDQYALALLLYRALTGALPFAAQDSGELLDQIEHAAPRPASTHDPRLTAAVDACFARALDKQPAARFASCSELVGSLGAALEGERESPLPPFATQPLDEALRSELAIAPAEPRRAAPQPAAPQPATPPRRSWRGQLAILAAGFVAGLGLGAAVLLRGEPEASPLATAPAPTLSAAAPSARDSDTTPASTTILLPTTAPVSAPEPTAGANLVAAPPGEAAETATPERLPPGVASSYGTLRVRLISEGPAGRLTVLLDGEQVVAERFHFGGPFGFLRQRPRGGQLELVRQVPARPATLSVRVELADRIQVIPLRAEWDEDLELTLETRVGLDRSVTATLR